MLSIIIPIYNAEEYLAKALNSLVSQTCGAFEVLMIDDGSTDSSYDICKSFAQEDCRFKAYHIENSGVSAARNYGLSLAQYEIITFLDSDDYVSSDYCEVILREMGSAELLVFQTIRHLPNGRLETLLSNHGLYSGKDNIESALYALRTNGIDEFGWPWNKAFRKTLIEKGDVSFPPDVYWFEDEVFALRYASNVQTLKIIENVLHHYIVRGDSLTYSKIPAPKVERVADLMNGELDNFSNQAFLSSLKDTIFSFYLLSAKLEDNNTHSRIKRFIKTRHYYQKEKENLTGLGKLSRVIFGSPFFIGLIVFALFKHRI